MNAPLETATHLSPVDFLRGLFGGTTGQTYLCALRNSDSKLPKGELDHTITRSPDEVKKFVAKWDRPEHECGIYFCTATLKQGATRRVAENCEQYTSLFADVDDKNHELSREEALERLEQCECAPAFIVDTGNGLHPYWMQNGPSDDVERVHNCASGHSGAHCIRQSSRRTAGDAPARFA